MNPFIPVEDKTLFQIKLKELGMCGAGCVCLNIQLRLLLCSHSSHVKRAVLCKAVTRCAITFELIHFELKHLSITPSKHTHKHSLEQPGHEASDERKDKSGD